MRTRKGTNYATVSIYRLCLTNACNTDSDFLQDPDCPYGEHNIREHLWRQIRSW